jgi:hypothetical protein
MAAIEAAPQRDFWFGQGDQFAARARAAISIRPLRADSVEKLCFQKKASESWNIFLTRVTSENLVSKRTILGGKVPPILPLSTNCRVFQQNRLEAVIRCRRSMVVKIVNSGLLPLIYIAC